MLALVALGAVEVAPGTPCFSREAVDRIERQLRGPAAVALTPSRSGVLVSFRRGSKKLEREVPTTADCAAVERVVLALVRAWSEEAERASAPRSTSFDAGATVRDGAAPSDRGDGGNAQLIVQGTSRRDGGGDGSTPTRRDGGRPNAELTTQEGSAEAAQRDGGRPNAELMTQEGSTEAARRDGGRPNAKLMTQDGSLGLGRRDGTEGPPRDGGSSTVSGGSSTPERESRGARTVVGGGTSALTTPEEPDTAARRDGGGAGLAADATRRDRGGPEDGARAGVTSERSGGEGADAGNVTLGRSSGAREATTPGASTGAMSGRSGGLTLGRNGEGEAATPVAPRRGGAEAEATNANEFAALGPGLDGRIDAGSPAPPTRSWTFGASLGGGINSGASADVLPHGLLVLDASLRFFGVSVDLGFTGSTPRSVGNATITASTQWASVAARFAFTMLERVTLEAFIGPRLVRLSANATGVNQLRPAQATVLFGGMAALQVSVRVAGPIGVFLRGTFQVREAATLVVTNVGAVDLGPLDGSASGGLCARW